jgi:hypothetical protein
MENLPALWSLLKLPFFAFLGAFMLYALNRLNQKEPFSLLKVLNINVGVGASPGVIFLDMLVSSTLGTAVILPLTSPATIPQAVVAGLGMTGILAAHSKEK